MPSATGRASSSASSSTPTATGCIDQWSYYQDGFEVYRENDLNDDKSLDECRWMNAAGTRIAATVELGGKIIGLEADLGRGGLEGPRPGAGLRRPRPCSRRCSPPPRSSTALGVPKGEVEQVAAAARKRERPRSSAGQKRPSGWNSKTVWSRLDGMMPHLIPADPRPG